MPYFFDTIKRTTLAVAKQFKDYQIQRTAEDNSASQTINVELIYADKQKFYKMANSNLSNIQVVLPALALNCSAIEYDLERQKNKFYGLKVIDPTDDGIIKFIRNPSPILMTFTLLVKTKYYSDMRQLLEYILPNFQPSKTVAVPLLYELGISYDIEIILESLSTNFETDTESADAMSVNNYESELTFTVHSYLFPPIVDMYAAKTIKIYDETGLFSIYNSESPDSIINTNNIDFTPYAATKIAEYTFENEDVSQSGVYKIDMTSIISSEGENFKLVDSDGNWLPFVFEYSNYECYGNDESVPSYVTATKTGYVFVRVDYNMEDNEEINLPTKIKIIVNSYHHKNYCYANSVFDMYSDFNVATFDNVKVKKTTVNDKVYFSNGVCLIKSFSTTFSNLLKIQTKQSQRKFTEARVRMQAFTFTSVLSANKFLLGMHDHNGKVVYVKTGTANKSYTIIEEYNGTIVNTQSVTTTNQILTVRFYKDSNNAVVININDEITKTLVQEYTTLWIGANMDTYMKYDVFMMY